LAEIDRLTPFGVRLRYGALDETIPVARASALGWAEQAIAWAGTVVEAAS